MKAVFDYFRDTEWYIEWLGKQLGVDRRPEHVGADWTWPGKSVCMNVCMHVYVCTGMCVCHACVCVFEYACDLKHTVRCCFLR